MEFYLKEGLGGQSPYWRAAGVTFIWNFYDLKPLTCTWAFFLSLDSERAMVRNEPDRFSSSYFADLFLIEKSCVDEFI